MKRFFVYTLPRSGSAWLSMFLSQPGSYCYHEPLADGDWQALYKRMNHRTEPCVGAIDTGAFAKGKPSVAFDQIFVLIRDKTEINNSLKLKGWVIDLAKVNEQFESLTREFQPIFYSKLWDVGYLADLWMRVTGSSCDRERAERLIEMVIQRNFASVARRAWCA